MYSLENIKEDFPDIDPEIISEVIYYDYWSSYEEYGGILIFKAFDDSYQLVDYGYCVFGDPPEYEYISEITEDQVKVEIEEMKKLITLQEII